MTGPYDATDKTSLTLTLTVAADVSNVHASQGCVTPEA